MFGIQEHLIREVSGLKERSLGEEMDPVRSWVRNVGVVDANVAAQRYGTNQADLLHWGYSLVFHQVRSDLFLNVTSFSFMITLTFSTGRGVLSKRSCKLLVAKAGYIPYKNLE